jgi:hypothetical protein
MLGKELYGKIFTFLMNVKKASSHYFLSSVCVFGLKGAKREEKGEKYCMHE